MDQNYLLAVTFGTHSNFSKLLIAELKDILTDEKEINYTSRAVERGAMLIGYETGGTRVWLQMPRGQNFIFPFWRNHVFLFSYRVLKILLLQFLSSILGNLETIHLKRLLLNKLKGLLNDMHFKDAAIIMKKHRIDMNLFYDHNPQVSCCEKP